MDELIKHLNYFVELGLINVSNAKDGMIEGYYLFTLTPLIGSRFEDRLYQLLSNKLSQPKLEISCDIRETYIKFYAHPNDEDKLIGVFTQILEEYIDGLEVLKFANSIGKKSPSPQKAPDITIGSSSPIDPILSQPPSPESINAALEELQKEQDNLSEQKSPKEISSSTQSSPQRDDSPTIRNIHTHSNTFRSSPPKTPGQVSENERLTNRLHSCLTSLVTMMEQRTASPKSHPLNLFGYVSKTMQAVKNTANSYIYTPAAINMKNELKPFIAGGKVEYSIEDLNGLIRLLNGRLLHVQHDDLKDDHSVEITTLNSAIQHAQTLLTNLIDRRGFQPITPYSISPNSDSPTASPQ